MPNFIDLDTFSKSQIENLITKALEIKQDPTKYSKTLGGKTLAMIYQKLSLRTRVSFEMAMRGLGGHVINLNQSEIHLGKNEDIKDTARVLSQMVDLVGIRCFAHSDIQDFAKYSKIPVINALTDYSHPCQILAAALTFIEKFGTLENKKLAWVGSYNNVLRSYIHLASVLKNFDLVVSCPEIFLVKDEIKSPNISVIFNPKEAVQNADVIITDTWVSMGETDGEFKKSQLQSYQVNEKLMSYAKPTCLFSHCLPAHRGEEVVDEVIDGVNSVVFDEAENRIHIQKSIILYCLNLL